MQKRQFADTNVVQKVWVIVLLTLILLTLTTRISASSHSSILVGTISVVQVFERYLGVIILGVMCIVGVGLLIAHYKKAPKPKVNHDDELKNLESMKAEITGVITELEGNSEVNDSDKSKYEIGKAVGIAITRLQTVVKDIEARKKKLAD